MLRTFAAVGLGALALASTSAAASASSPASPTAASGTRTFLDRPWGPQPWAKLDAYVPEDPVGIVVYLRGGGDAAGGKDVGPAAYQPFLARDLAFVSSDYPGYDTEGGVFPVPQRAAATLLRFLDEPTVRDALELGDGPFVVAGKSYGAMIWSSVAYARTGTYSHPPVAAVVNLLGMLDWRLLASTATPAWEHITGSSVPMAAARGSAQWQLEQQPLPALVPPTWSWYGQAVTGTAPLSDVHDPLFGLRLHGPLDRLGLEHELVVGAPLDLARAAAFVRRVIR